MLKRICKEVVELLESPCPVWRPTGLTADLAEVCQEHLDKKQSNETLQELGVSLFDPTTSNHRYAVRYEMRGAAGTPLEDGLWEVEVFPPSDYPFHPCTFHLITPAYHPDVPISEALEIGSLEGKEDEAALKGRIVAARDAALLTAGTSEGAASKAQLREPGAVAVTFKTMSDNGWGGEGQSLQVYLADSDTLADAQRRYESTLNTAGTSTSHVCYSLSYKGRQWTDDDANDTLSTLGVQSGDTIHVIPRMLAGVCGPLAVLEGQCETCRTSLYPFSPAMKIHEMLLGMSECLHGHRELRADMEKTVPGSFAEVDGMKGWNPWVALVDPGKVRNLHAGAMLAEGKMEEYEAVVKEFTRKFASSKQT
mmetsp:Transcript_25064/g.30326  ORF Transcript_25064/g.30326 Transcript_25064/m.30326 type:complete len:366 (-) Transcript_25064:261-1358(-)